MKLTVCKSTDPFDFVSNNWINISKNKFTQIIIFRECFNFEFLPLFISYLRKAVNLSVMTPELKTACEVIFQEHKLSNQVKWNRDAFRGQISLGLSELAKDTLVKKKILLLPDKSRKVITLLNPAVVDAGSFEEAEEIIITNKQPVTASVEFGQQVYVANQVFKADIPKTSLVKKPIAAITQTPAVVAESKWYMKPIFYYVIWPICAAIAGILLTFLISTTYTELFWR